jgi:hypothetical protein
MNIDKGGLKTGLEESFLRRIDMISVLMDNREISDEMEAKE